MDNNGLDPRQNSEQPSARRSQQPQRRSQTGQPASQRAGSGARRPANKRRRRRSKAQIFKETYLPMILLGLAVILVITIIVTLSVNSKKRKEAAKASSIHAAQSEEAYRLQLEQEAASLIIQADALADSFDYDGAIAVLDSFSDEAKFNDFQELVQKRTEYEKAKETLVAWADPGQIIHLSTHHLVAEPERAFADATYKSTIKFNFITVNEFSAILESLYENDYILVSMRDIVEEQVGSDGSVTYKTKTLYLPAGKKPLMITQTHNSPSYVFDNNGDGDPDCVSGFASRLLVTGAGEVTCEYTNRRNSTSTGDFDLVPILESFIKEHPDFSYRGARAVIAVTGRHFLFGYQTNPAIRTSKGADYYDQQVADATAVATRLKELGYEFACYTYANKRYGELELSEVQEDVAAWKAEVEPILGPVNMLVYAMDSDIASPEDVYSGSKYEALSSAGFHYFIGFCDDAAPWMTVTDSYVRQGRLTVNGSKLISDPGLYEDYFDAVSAKDKNRK